MHDPAGELAKIVFLIFLLLALGGLVWWVIWLLGVFFSASVNVTKQVGAAIVDWNARRVEANEQAALETAAVQRQRDETARQERALAHEREKLHEPIAQLQAYYAEVEAYVRDRYPAAIITAFIRYEMGEGKTVRERWEACHRMIAQLQALVVERMEERRRQVAEREQRRQQLARRIREIDEAIAGLHREISLQQASPLDVEIIEQEVAGIRLRIRELQIERYELTEELNRV